MYIFIITALALAYQEVSVERVLSAS